ncbi:sulfite exporter TauE/SafE family protein [Acetonema longum]|uniref:Probable membrane transporter protein n=1 Tax=Acetonema longum DSM 6540 TaxID=1009370 RepID=F7NKK7_9FIRM|nr:sulfite exporter TauE/SafE family protein [Acetonema longum]EGO63415.1 hypothetical protein ALO_13129 [Acetonema longum DSM 6540]
MELDIVLILRIAITISALIFLVYFVKDCITHKDEFGKEHTFLYSVIGFVTCVFDTLGIGNMATSMTAFRLTKSVKDEHLCGTGNVAFCITTIVEFILFVGLVKVDTLTLVSMIVVAIIGSLVGVSIATRWSIVTVRKVLGVALTAVAIVMACRNLNVGPFGQMGTATSLDGVSLALGLIGIFFLGALQTMGIGMFAPTMALVSMLGMSVTAAFPIMMGACSFVMPWCSIKFVKEGKYNRKASVILTITGVFGVLLAYYVIKSLPLTTLIWVVVCVLLYTSFTFFRQIAQKEDQQGESAQQQV